MTLNKDELVALAGKLTPTLRRALGELTEQPQMKPISWCVKWGYRLERLGLAKRMLLSDRSFLTPLGLALREHLIQDTNHE